jgi:hypothetical protein
MRKRQPKPAADARCIDDEDVAGSSRTVDEEDEFGRFLDSARYALLRLRARQFALEAFQNELLGVTKGTTFAIANDIVWRAMLDSRDANVIAFASWCKGSTASGGFFRTLKSCFLPSIPVRRPWRADPPEVEEAQADTFDQVYASTRSRLFPLAQGRGIRHPDVDDLANGFAKAAEPLLADRDDNRAHPFERSNRGTLKMLNLEETRELFTNAFKLLNDLALLGTGSTLASTEMNRAPSDGTAEEIVDIILLPKFLRDLLRSKGLRRALVYEALHARSDGSAPFNEPQSVQAYAAELRV